MSFKLRQVTAVELAAMVSQGFENVVVKIAHEKAPKNIGNFHEVLEFSNYIDNEMIIAVTNVEKINSDDGPFYAFDFDATMFEGHNKQYERAQFTSDKNSDHLLTSREKAKESQTPFSMTEESLYFNPDDIFYLVENYSDFLTYSTDAEVEEAILPIKMMIAETENNEEIKNLVNIGYFAKKQHLGTLTDTEKRVYRTLLAKQ